MSTSTAPHVALARQLIDRIDAILRDAEAQTRPLELDPFRNDLFELFVTAHGAGFLRESADPDLSADGLCRVLAERWGLATVTHSAERLPAQNVSQMRLLWSLMRMWMEWTYAWQQWNEFHQSSDARGA
jgi:hypothetical protein